MSELTRPPLFSVAWTMPRLLHSLANNSIASRSTWEEKRMLDRRSFLAGGSGLAAALAFRGNIVAKLDKAGPVRDRSLYDKNEDAYWAEMRKQFLIPADEIYLSNGRVGSRPAPVLRAVFDGYADTERMDAQDPEDYPIWGYAAWNEFRDPLAAFVGGHRNEIALLRNATEANSYIANGIDMKPGDEVLMTDQEHPGGEHPWNLKAKRYGIVMLLIGHQHFIARLQVDAIGDVAVRLRG